MLAWALCVISLIVIFGLLIKYWLLKQSIQHICTELREHLSSDSNTLISVSINDKDTRRLANELNHQLRQLRQQRQQYLNGNNQLKEAVTNVSHDLRTPLTAIFGYLELLEKERQTTNAKRYLSIIRGRVENLTQLTEELFQYSIVLDPQAKPIEEKVNLNEILEESLSAFYVMLKKCGIEPLIQMPSQKVVRYLSSSTLTRVLFNLLNNAVKYSDGDLMITLSEAGDITFTNTATQLNLVQVEKLLHRFFTVDNARKSTGLGLGITKNLVEQMGGTLTVSYQDSKLSICLSFPDVF